MIKNILYFKREHPLEKTALFLRSNIKMNNELAHITEHILIARLENDGFDIIGGHSTEDYIKIDLKNNFDVKVFNPNNYLYLFDFQEFNRAVNEIRQENSLKTNEIKDILSKIRKSEKQNTYYKDLDYYNQILKTIMNKITFIIVNNDFYTEKPQSIISDSDVKKSKKSDFTIEDGVISHKEVNFFFKYINIPISIIKKESTIFFIQKLVNFMNLKMNNLRSKGSYYSLSFALYSRTKIEIFLLISFTDDINFNLNLEIENMLKDYDIKESSNTNYGEKVYEYKENLSVIYMSPDFLMSSNPNVSDESIWITNKLIQKISY